MSKLFEPSALPMKADYPELAKVEEFDGITDRDLRLVWYWSAKGSKYSEIQDLPKRANAIARAEFGGKIGLVEIRDWEKGKFPDPVKVAMDRMRRFAPTDRSRAKDMVEKIFDTYEKIVGAALDDLLDDMDKQKKYIDNTSNIVDRLPILIKHKEEGFGYKRDRVTKAGERKQMNLMDKVSEEEVDENDDNVD